MPVIESAKKALRRDRRRTVVNKRVREKFREALKKAREEKSEKAVSSAYSQIDIAAKKNVIHKNKAGRLKSRLSKLVAGKSAGKKLEKAAGKVKKVKSKKVKK